MELILNGYCGKMGRAVRSAMKREPDLTLFCGVDPAVTGNEPDAVYPDFSFVPTGGGTILDFSRHDGIREMLRFALLRHLPAVIATTGHTEEEKALIRGAATEIPIFFSPNFSLGTALLIRFACRAAQIFPDAEIEILETHRAGKTDAPSGTALAAVDALRKIRPDATAKVGRQGDGVRAKNEIGIHSIRLGNGAGEHEIRIASPGQILTLKHETRSRLLYAEGALRAVRFLDGKEPGLYGMEDLPEGSV